MSQRSRSEIRFLVQLFSALVGLIVGGVVGVLSFGSRYAAVRGPYLREGKPVPLELRSYLMWEALGPAIGMGLAVVLLFWGGGYLLSRRR